MKVTRAFLLVAALVSFFLFWTPAYFFPDDTRNAVSTAYCVLCIITSGVLFVDIYDLIRVDGEGISWQAALGKVGIFLMTAAFAMASGWALLVSIKGFPADLVRSPIPAYLRYMQGLGLGALFLGFNDPASSRPRINTGLTIAVVLACGIAIGLALGHLPILSSVQNAN